MRVDWIDFICYSFFGLVFGWTFRGAFPFIGGVIVATVLMFFTQVRSYKKGESMGLEKGVRQATGFILSKKKKQQGRFVIDLGKPVINEKGEEDADAMNLFSEAEKNVGE